jgi:predicted nuclease of predicted toxin-antitoxin system
LRILIDECLPVQLRHIFVGHDARTIVHMSWRSLNNGQLLAAAEREQFDIFITADARIPTTHDIAGSHLAVVVVPTNRRKILDQITSAILDAVTQAKPGEVLIVSLPRATRRQRRSRTR